MSFLTGEKGRWGLECKLCIIGFCYCISTVIGIDISPSPGDAPLGILTWVIPRTRPFVDYIHERELMNPDEGWLNGDTRPSSNQAEAGGFTTANYRCLPWSSGPLWRGEVDISFNSPRYRPRGQNTELRLHDGVGVQRGGWRGKIPSTETMTKEATVAQTASKKG